MKNNQYIRYQNGNKEMSSAVLESYVLIKQGTKDPKKLIETCNWFKFCVVLVGNPELN